MFQTSWCGRGSPGFLFPLWLLSPVDQETSLCQQSEAVRGPDEDCPTFSDRKCKGE